MNTTTTHTLTFDVPTWNDYLKGGFGDLVAQCSCGQFEFVYSEQEGNYWHELHTAQPSRDARYLMLNTPMPAGWVRTAPVVAIIAAGSTTPRSYACSTCKGARSVAAYGPVNGLFYHHGERCVCGDCGGTGRTSTWTA